MKKEGIRKNGKRLLTILLSISVLLTYSVTKSPSYAADGDNITTDVTLGASGRVEAKAINVKANAMKINPERWDNTEGQYLYFGAYNNGTTSTPVKYRVLDRHNGTSNTKFNDGTATMTTLNGDYLLLDSDATLFKAPFRANTTSISNDYSKSDIIKYLKDGNGSNGKSLFSSKELSAIADTTLNASDQSYGAGRIVSTGINEIFKDYAASGKSFLLSEAELVQLYNGIVPRMKAGAAQLWWQRSASTSDEPNSAGMVDVYGILGGTNVWYTTRAVAPASNLNLSSVLFTSDSNAVKEATLAKITSSTDKTWKVTLKDTNKIVKTTGTITRNEDTITVPYSYTDSDSEVTQVSIVLTDGDIDDSDTSVLYYGKLADASGSSGQGNGTFIMPKNLPSKGKAYIIAEDVNEWMKTDYASSPLELSIPADPETEGKALVTFDSKGGSTVESTYIKSGETLAEPTKPTKTGYTFDDWYTDAAYTTAYDFSSKVTEDITLYARWVVPGTLSSIDRSYTPTADLEKTADATGAERDEDQKNYQQSDGSTKDDFAYKAFEWVDKTAGKGRITISTKKDIKKENSYTAVYAFTDCTAHRFSKAIAISNIKFLVEHYGSVDLIIADGLKASETVTIQNVKLTDETEIKALLDKHVTFASSKHFNLALYEGMCKYFKTNDPFVVYTSFDSEKLDEYSDLPKATEDIWSKLKAYKAAGRYFSMGMSTGTLPVVSTANARDSIRIGLANPEVFVSMTSLTTSAETKCDFSYKETFKAIDESGGHIAYSSLSVKDTVSNKFTINKVTTNREETSTVNIEGNTVSVGFLDLDSSNVGEVYIDVTLTDRADQDSINTWLKTNDGSASVTFTDQNNKIQASTVNSPEAYYPVPAPEKNYNITTEVVNGTIDENCVVGEGNNKSIYYEPDEGYILKSVTVDGVPVSIETYPDHYKFVNVSKDHHIKVVYAKGYNITTSVKGGSIDDSCKVAEGNDKTISYSPSKGYKLTSVTVDGISVDISKYPSKYTFKDISDDHTISVVYTKTDNIVKPGEDGNGESQSPGTGDNGPLIYLVLLCVTSIFLSGMVIAVRRRKI